ncbi:MAG: hypothetical protein ACI4EU_02085 [Butyrivibrio sp.]
MVVYNNNFIGDYIDRGNQSYECIKIAFDLEREFGKEKVIVLKVRCAYEINKRII